MKNLKVLENVQIDKGQYKFSSYQPQSVFPYYLALLIFSLGLLALLAGFST